MQGVLTVSRIHQVAVPRRAFDIDLLNLKVAFRYELDVNLIGGFPPTTSEVVP